MRYYIANGLFLAVFSATVTNAEWLRFISSDLKPKVIDHDDPTAGYYVIGWARDNIIPNAHKDHNQVLNVVYGSPSTIGNRVNWSRVSANPNDENGVEGVHYWVTTESLKHQRGIVGIGTYEVENEDVPEGGRVKQLVTKVYNPKRPGSLEQFYCPAPGAADDYRLGDRGKINADITTEALVEMAPNGLNERKAVRIPAAGKSAVGIVVNPLEHRWEANTEGFKYLQWPNPGVDQWSTSDKGPYWLCERNHKELPNVYGLYISSFPLSGFGRKCKRGYIVSVPSQNEDDSNAGVTQNVNPGYAFGASGTEHSAPDFGSQYSIDDLEGSLVDKLSNDPEANPNSVAEWQLKQMQRAYHYFQSKNRLAVFDKVNTAASEDDYAIERPEGSPVEAETGEDVPAFVQDENQQKLIEDLAQLMAAEKPSVPQEPKKKKKLSLGSKIFPPINMYTGPQQALTPNNKNEKKKSGEKIPSGIAAKSRPFFDWMNTDDDYLRYNEEEREKVANFPATLDDLDEDARGLPPGLEGSMEDIDSFPPGLGWGVSGSDNAPFEVEDVDFSQPGDAVIAWPGSEPRTTKPTRPVEHSRAGPGVDYMDFQHTRVPKDREETDKLREQRWRETLDDYSGKTSLMDQVIKGTVQPSPPKKRDTKPEEETKYDPYTGKSVPPSEKNFKGDEKESSTLDPLRNVIQKNEQDEQISYTEEDDDDYDEVPEETVTAPEEPVVVEVVEVEEEPEAAPALPPINRPQLIIDNEHVPEVEFNSQEEKGAFLNKLRADTPNFQSRVGTYKHFERSYLKNLKDRINIYTRGLLNKSIQEYYEKNDFTTPYTVPNSVLQSEALSGRIGVELNRLAAADNLDPVNLLVRDIADYTSQLPSTKLGQDENAVAAESLRSQGQDLLAALNNEKLNKKTKEQKDSVEKSLKTLDRALVRVEWERSFAVLRESYESFIELVRSGDIGHSTKAEATKLRISITEATEKAKALKLGSLKRDVEMLDEMKRGLDQVILSADVAAEFAALATDIKEFAGDDDEQRTKLMATVDALIQKLSIMEVREGEWYRPSLITFKSALAPKPVVQVEQPSTDDVVVLSSSNKKEKKNKKKKAEKTKVEDEESVELEGPAEVQQPVKKNSADLEKEQKELNELRNHYVNTLPEEQRNKVIIDDQYGKGGPVQIGIKKGKKDKIEEFKLSDIPYGESDGEYNLEEEEDPEQPQPQEPRRPNPFEDQVLDQAIDRFVQIQALFTQKLGPGPLADAATNSIIEILQHELGGGSPTSTEKATMIANEFNRRSKILQGKAPANAIPSIRDEAIVATLIKVVENSMINMALERQNAEAAVERIRQEREQAEREQVERLEDQELEQSAYPVEEALPLIYRDMMTYFQDTQEYRDAAALLSSLLMRTLKITSSSPEQIAMTKGSVKIFAEQLLAALESGITPVEFAQRTIVSMARVKEEVLEVARKDLRGRFPPKKPEDDDKEESNKE